MGAASTPVSCVYASLSLPWPVRRSRWGVFLTLDLVVCCPSTSGAGFEFWCPGTLCWSPVPSTLRRLENLSIFLVRGYGSGFLPPTSGRHLSVVLPASAVDCCLSSLRAGVCSLLWQRRVPARVLMVACLPLLRVGSDGCLMYP